MRGRNYTSYNYKVQFPTKDKYNVDIFKQIFLGLALEMEVRWIIVYIIECTSLTSVRPQRQMLPPVPCW